MSNATNQYSIDTTLPQPIQDPARYVWNPRIGDSRLTPATAAGRRVDVRQPLLFDIHERLLGRSLKVSGSIIQADQRPGFIARSLEAIF